MRGRRPKLQLVSNVRDSYRGGTARHTPKRSRPPQPVAHLSPHAKSLWRKLLPELWRVRHITAADLPAFAAYCSAWGQAVAARQEFEKMAAALPAGEAMLIKATKGVKRNPLLQIERDALVLLARLAGDLGLTPVARGRVETEEPRERSPADEFFND